ncbi:Gfo/Idh/MocA family oxidoreductase [soil metagenome]
MTSISTPSRRTFLKSAVAGAAGLALPASVRAASEGANGEARIAVIGIRSQGNGHINRTLSGKGCRLVAICDADSDVLAQRKGDCEKAGAKVEAYTDYRKLIENPDIDGVMIATPNHLHTLIAVAAAQAGKHVYVEKPVSHNIWEGRQLARAAEVYDKVVIHHGMQRRSDTGWREIGEWIKDEPLGKMICSRGLCYKNRPSIGKLDAPKDPPSSVDYNLWSGPREIMPVRRAQFHYDWHWQFPYGNGDIGNQGPHQLDVARWMLGDPQLPARVMSIGGRFGYEDDGNTPNTQIAFFDYKPVPLIFEVRGLPRADMDYKGGDSDYKGGRIANVLEFEGGYVVEGKAVDNDGKTVHKFGVTDGSGHFENWIESIHTGKKDPNFSAETGHLSSALAHMANVSYQLGEGSDPGEINERLSGDKLAAESFARMQEHLEANGVDLSKSQAQAGPWLDFDPESETFTGEFGDKANEAATGSYRDEFAIPKIG